MDRNFILDEIEAARSRNNRYWMSLLRLALDSSPTEAQAILDRINHTDDEISVLTKKLTEKYP